MIRHAHVMLLLCGLLGSLHAQDRLVTLSTVKARPLALGGAYTAFEDGLTALAFNPAGYQAGIGDFSRHLSVDFNTMAPLVFIRNRGGYNKWDAVGGLLFHGLGFSWGRIQIGLIWGDESMADISRLERTNWFNADGFSENHNSTLGFSVALAPRVRIGMVADLYHRSRERSDLRKLGYRYGVILQPRPSLKVGLCFVDLPDDFSDERKTLERFADESLNIGVAYTPWQPVTIALDFRNVSGENLDVSREPHIGIEIAPVNKIFLRSGYYRSQRGEVRVFSMGLGYVTSSGHSGDDRFFFHPHFELHASLLWQEDNGINSRWLVLTGVFQI